MCVCALGGGERATTRTHTDTQRRKEGEAHCKLQSIGEKENLTDFKHSCSCSAHLGPKCSMLNMPVTDLRPWSSVKGVVTLNQDSKSETKQQAGLRVGHRLRSPQHARFCRAVPLLFSADGAFCWEAGVLSRPESCSIVSAVQSQ